VAANAFGQSGTRKSAGDPGASEILVIGKRKCPGYRYNLTLDGGMPADPIFSSHVKLINYSNHTSCQLSRILRRQPVRAIRHGSFEIHQAIQRQHANLLQTPLSHQTDFIQYPLLDLAIAHCQYQSSLSQNRKAARR